MLIASDGKHIFAVVTEEERIEAELEVINWFLELLEIAQAEEQRKEE